MNAIKRNIPNIITLANLFCGLSAILFAFEGNLVLSATFIFCGAFFDFIDGLFARILEVKEELGKRDPYCIEPLEKDDSQFLIEGNDALALGALYGGVAMVSWYPITP